MRRAKFGPGHAIAGGLAALVLAASPAMASYTFETIGRFDYDPGADPEGGVIAVGDRLYGVTAGGGVLGNSNHEYGLGVVYSLPIAGGAYKAPDWFNIYTGISPDTNLTAVGDTLYGTASQGGYGPDGNGTIFSIGLAPGDELVNLATFNGQIGPPTTTLVALGNRLYGGAGGGAFGDGVIYSESNAGGPISIVFSFNHATNDRGPHGKLLLVGDTIYGVTSGGGLGKGSVYSYNLTTNTYKKLGTFNGPNGETPIQGVILGGNQLYGTTSAGGAHGTGTVYALPVTGGVITPLASFTANQAIVSGVTLVGNMLYGTENIKGGSVFSVPIFGGGGAPKTVMTFNGANGFSPDPNAGLTLVGATLYGTTSGAGSPDYGVAADPGHGTVFSLTPDEIVTVTKALANGIGAEVGALSVVSANGAPQIGRVRFSPTVIGHAALSDPNWPHDVETFALHLFDKATDRLGPDLTDVVWELNAAKYNGFTVRASRIDPTINPNAPTGRFGGNYNLFITVRATGSSRNPPAFGFDLARLNGTLDTLAADQLAVLATPIVTANAAGR
jgi:uncharacterized repeat protein (TIGR03803 family)